MINKSELGKGFWIGLGVVAALFVWGLLSGAAGRLTSRA